jgi:hypothetical protein
MGMIGDVAAALWSVVLVAGATACFEEAPGPSEASGPDDTGDPTDGGTSSGSGPIDPDSSSTGPDAACPTGFSCAAAVPPGWQGPVARFLGPEGSLPDCAGDYPYAELEARTGLQAPPAECMACGCDDPAGVECQGPMLRMYTSLSCAGSPALQFELGVHDECIVFGEYGIATDGMEADPVVPIADTGACSPSGGEATLPEPTWAEQLRACGGAPDAGACGEGGSCLPTPGNPLAPGLCAWVAGDVPCPAGPYALRTVVYDGYDDARECSDCMCGDVAGVDCQAIVEVHYNSACSNLRASVDDPQAGACYDIDDGGGYAPRSGKMIVYDTQGGGCPPAGGQPVGEASPAGPTTFCCTQ